MSQHLSGAWTLYFYGKWNGRSKRIRGRYVGSNLLTSLSLHVLTALVSRNNMLQSDVVDQSSV